LLEAASFIQSQKAAKAEAAKKKSKPSETTPSEEKPQTPPPKREKAQKPSLRVNVPPPPRAPPVPEALPPAPQRGSSEYRLRDVETKTPPPAPPANSPLDSNPAAILSSSAKSAPQTFTFNANPLSLSASSSAVPPKQKPRSPTLSLHYIADGYSTTGVRRVIPPEFRRPATYRPPQPLLRRMKRRPEELRDDEKWKCPHHCGKFYRKTSTRSIQKHLATCPPPPPDCAAPTVGGISRKRNRDEAPTSPSGATSSSSSSDSFAFSPAQPRFYTPTMRRSYAATGSASVPSKRPQTSWHPTGPSVLETTGAERRRLSSLEVKIPGVHPGLRFGQRRRISARNFSSRNIPPPPSKPAPSKPAPAVNKSSTQKKAPAPWLATYKAQLKHSLTHSRCPKLVNAARRFKRARMSE